MRDKSFFTDSIDWDAIEITQPQPGVALLRILSEPWVCFDMRSSALYNIA
jgi:hypothetical protein